MPAPAVRDLTAPDPDAERVEVIAGPAPRVDVGRHKRLPRSGVAACGTPVTQEQLTDDMDFDCPRCWRNYTGRM